MLPESTLNVIIVCATLIILCLIKLPTDPPKGKHPDFYDL